MTDTQTQFKNAFKAMAILVAFFAAIAFLTSCTKTEVIEKTIVQEPDKNQDLMYFTRRYNSSQPRFCRSFRYHANMSSPKDSLFYYTSFWGYADTQVFLKWIPVVTHDIANLPVNVIISRKPPKDGEEPQ